MPIKSLIGQRFARLKVIDLVHGPSRHPVKRSTRWKCICDCGNFTEALGYNLVSGHVKSCGCFARERAVKTNTTHGLSKTRFYQCWRDMRVRVESEKSFAFNRYGGRGITICDEWLTFENFMADMYQDYLDHCEKFGIKETTLDRIDNQEGYCKANCRWATNKEQARNRESKKYYIEGRYLSAYQIAEQYNLTYSTVMHRLCRNWPLEKVILPPIRRRQNATNAN